MTEITINNKTKMTFHLEFRHWNVAWYYMYVDDV